MNIEDLSKSQLILLTVLVNFVTSVATGILVVSLLDKAPPVVTQTINRIVEHTVETVAQAAPAAVIQAPKPSVEDLITAAFAADVARTVDIYAANAGTSTEPIASGTFLPKTKVVVTAAGASLPAEVKIGFHDGSFAPASTARADSLLVIYGFGDGAVLPNTAAPSLVAAKDLKIGQTALALTLDGSAATGIVAKVTDAGVTTTLPQAIPGTAAVDLSGNVIGIALGGENGVFVSTDHIKTLLTATSSPPASP